MSLLQENPRRGTSLSEQIENNLKRLKTLPQESICLDVFEGGKIERWIPENTAIQVFLNLGQKSKVLILDDEEAYALLKEEVEKTDDVFQAIQNSLGNYFEHQEHTPQISRERKELFFEKEGPSHVSIKSLKGRSVCMDKCLLAHNFFHVLGMESTIICSDDCKVEDQDIGNHAYLLIKKDDSHWLYDPENTHLSVEGETETHKPSVYPLNKTQYEQLLRGENGVDLEWIRSTLNGKIDKARIHYGTPVQSREAHTRKIIAEKLKRMLL